MAESSRDVPDFLSRSDAQIPEGIVGRLPAADDVSIPVQTQLIVEFARGNGVDACSVQMFGCSIDTDIRALTSRTPDIHYLENYSCIFDGVDWSCPAR